MERSIILTGVGGEGVQLAASIIARAIVLDGGYVSMIGLYSGEMRGGPSECSLSFSDMPVEAPLILSECNSAIVLNPTFWPATAAKVSRDALVLFDSDQAAGEHERAPYRAVAVRATEIARTCGSQRLASLVIASAYVELAGIALNESMVKAMEELVPSYRRDRVAANREALKAGAEAGRSLRAEFQMEAAR
jgi:2-oxoglutarate ferredoxin oxidoreductase subunit gamma